MVAVTAVAFLEFLALFDEFGLNGGTQSAVAALEGLHGCAFFGIEVDLHRERFLCVFVASA